MAYIEMQHSYKRYQMGSTTITANDDVSFGIEKGELAIILGASGAGKSTVLNILGGMDTNSEGSVVIDGRDISNYSPKQQTAYRRTDSGFVFQFYNLVANLTAKENVELASQIVSDAQDAVKVLEDVGLGDRVDNFPAQLSGGEQQRVAIARTLVLKPRILLLDEPLSALDGLIKESIKERIRMIARQFELTPLIVTPDAEEALTLSDRVRIINNGRIAQFADPMTIINKPADDFVNDFIISQLMVKRTNILKLFSGPNPKNAATLKAESGALA